MRRKKNIVVVTWGGVGDVMVCTPTLRAIKEKHPAHHLIVYCLNKQHRDVLLNNPYIDSLRLVGVKYMWKYPAHLYAYLFNPTKLKYYYMHFQHIPLSWASVKHVKDIVPEIFSDLALEIVHREVQLFFTRAEESKAREALVQYRNVVLMHIHSRSSANHHWPMEKWEELVKALPAITFIQIGHFDEQAVTGALDWRGKTSLREALCLLKYADSFVGVDSSLAHASNAFNLPGVVLFGDSSPVFWGHENNINIFKDVRCSPCYYYLDGDPCPYGHECMNQITVAEVQKALTEQLGMPGALQGNAARVRWVKRSV